MWRLLWRGPAEVGAWDGRDMGRRCGPERRSQRVEQPVMEGREEHFDGARARSAASRETRLAG